MEHLELVLGFEKVARVVVLVRIFMRVIEVLVRVVARVVLFAPFWRWWCFTLRRTSDAGSLKKSSVLRNTWSTNTILLSRVRGAY